MERPSMKGNTMQVLLEIIPDHMAILGGDKETDYEAFTLSNKWSAEEAFDAEVRKLHNPADIASVESFLHGPTVWRRLRAAFSRDISFTVLDHYVLCGNDGYTYRLSPYIAGKHSR